MSATQQIVLLLFVASLVASFMSKDYCDLSVDQGICLYGGQKVISPPGKPKGLVGKWDFDDELLLDSSGISRHAQVLPGSGRMHGPGVNDGGSSLRVSGKNYIEVPFAFGESNEYSVMFWVHITKESTLDGICPVIAHANEHGDSTFEISLHSKTKKVLASSRVDKEGNMGGKDTVSSKARLNRHVWYHVALVRSSEDIRLYVNGIMEHKTSLSGIAYFYQGSLFIGNAPFHSCSNSILIDNVQIFSIALEPSFIEASSFPSLGAISPRFARFGCDACSGPKAESSCALGYHPCSKLELISGAYSVGRNMGWVDSKSSLWTAEDISADIGASDDLKATICCVESFE